MDIEPCIEFHHSLDSNQGMKQISSFEEYESEAQNAQRDPKTFWEKFAKNFHWKKPWTQVLEGNFGDPSLKWFNGAKLNITENCLDRHLATRGKQLALIFEPNNPDSPVRKFTYEELHKEVCRAANMLESIGIQKGDRVCFYMSQIPELLIGILACARLGAVHSVVFAGFSARSLAGRIQDSGAKVLVTNDEALRGSKTISLKSICDEALLTCPNVQKTIVFKHTGTQVPWTVSRDLWWHELIKNCSSNHEARETDAEDPLFILYTSGSTGTPKGLLHTCAGYMVYAGYSFAQVFQMKTTSDIFWCTADIGWITGHSYLAYGPLLQGSTVLMFEGVPTWPNAGRFWQIIEKHKVTHFYTAPTAIRSLMSEDLNLVKDCNLTSLKVIGSVGEPINEEAWEWYYKNIGNSKCPLVDTWWQTETGGILISALAGVTEPKPTYATYPLPGIQPVLLDSNGKEIPFENGKESEGNLCIKNPWPSVARTIYGDHKRYQESYFSTYPGYYFTGDGAKRDGNGRFRITGRVDDVLNVSGHRLGTAELENAINEHPIVLESAVVGFPHDIKGQGICAYVICEKSISADKQPKITKEIHETVAKNIGPIAKPDRIIFVDALPKTRSGKIMRRILRKIAEGNTSDFGDISTLIDPSVVDKILRSIP